MPTRASPVGSVSTRSTVPRTEMEDLSACSLNSDLGSLRGAISPRISPSSTRMRVSRAWVRRSRVLTGISSRPPAASWRVVPSPSRSSARDCSPARTEARGGTGSPTLAGAQVTRPSMETSTRPLTAVSTAGSSTAAARAAARTASSAWKRARRASITAWSYRPSNWATRARSSERRPASWRGLANSGPRTWTLTSRAASAAVRSASARARAGPGIARSSPGRSSAGLARRLWLRISTPASAAPSRRSPKPRSESDSAQVCTDWARAGAVARPASSQAAGNRRSRREGTGMVAFLHKGRVGIHCQPTALRAGVSRSRSGAAGRDPPAAPPAFRRSGSS